MDEAPLSRTPGLSSTLVVAVHRNDEFFRAGINKCTSRLSPHAPPVSRPAGHNKVTSVTKFGPCELDEV
jgi:hypothetical protein